MKKFSVLSSQFSVPAMLLLVLVIAGAGCASNNATVARITLPNGLRIEQPKDVRFGKLTATVGSNGWNIAIEDYNSAANVMAIEAAGKADALKSDALVNALKAGADIAGKAAGAAVKP
jgi:hypothetical protein